MEILFVCSTTEQAVMPRHEASASDKTDASYLSMTEVKKDCNE
ncbi:hypothetical protein [Pedobacter punctiformis]|uniref:Uncharacterized protein n=1 Tax=Pedobacter punctiformis TaxID=3004097 RepID=A0ABT4L3E7_9SPHI|nr:hypothetical protein [Pedobacter sp. HCMS5-2]MCZ4242440.1 hypothetical protein [Pedobacter sp. HCMS5-2]